MSGMTGRIPPDLATAPNATVVIMDRYNMAHRLGAEPGRAACSTQGREATLGQAVVWARGWCAADACHGAPYVGKRRTR